MRFSEYYSALTQRQKNNLAAKLESSTHYLYLIATGRRNPGRKYVLEIPGLSKGKVKSHEVIYKKE